MKYIRKHINENFFDDEDISIEDLTKKESIEIVTKAIKEDIVTILYNDFIPSYMLDFVAGESSGLGVRTVNTPMSPIERNISNFCSLAEKFLEENNSNKTQNMSSFRKEKIEIIQSDKDMIKSTVEVEYENNEFIVYIWMTHRFRNTDEISFKDGIESTIEYLNKIENQLHKEYNVPVKIKFKYYDIRSATGWNYLSIYNNFTKYDTVISFDASNEFLLPRTSPISSFRFLCKRLGTMGSQGNNAVDYFFEFLEKVVTFDKNSYDTLYVPIYYTNSLAAKPNRNIKFNRINIEYQHYSMSDATKFDILDLNFDLQGLSTLLKPEGFVNFGDEPYTLNLYRDYIVHDLAKDKIQESDIDYLTGAVHIKVNSEDFVANRTDKHVHESLIYFPFDDSWEKCFTNDLHLHGALVTEPLPSNAN